MTDTQMKKIFANNLKRYLRQKNISGAELARTLEYPYATVKSWITGNRYPQMDRMEELAAFFGITKSDLIEDKQEPVLKEDGMWRMRAILRSRPDIKVLFDLSQKATPAEVEAAIQMLTALTKDKE